MSETQKVRGKGRNAHSEVRTRARGDDGDRPENKLGSDDLRDSPMMAHLLDALESGEDVGEYGRLTFAIIARHFMDDEDLVGLLAGQPGMGEEGARAILAQVQQRDYNPPKRARILEWQAKQDFQICPEPDDPNGCNVYRELRFPQEIYDRIGQFWEEKADAQM